MKSGVEFVGLFYGAAKLGLVVVPLNTRLAAPELAYILADSGARAFATRLLRIGACFWKTYMEPKT